MSEQVFEGLYAATTNPLPRNPYFIAIFIATLLILLTILVKLIYIFVSRIFSTLSKSRYSSITSQDRKKAPRTQNAIIYAPKKGSLGDAYAPSVGQLRELNTPRPTNKGLSGIFGRIIVPGTPPAGIKVNVPRDTVPLKTYRQVLSQLEEMTENWRRLKEELEKLRTGN